MIKLMDNTKGFMAYRAQYLILNKDQTTTAVGPKAVNYLDISSGTTSARNMIKWINKTGYTMK